jgi:hypothetical protein
MVGAFTKDSAIVGIGPPATEERLPEAIQVVGAAPIA